MSNRRRPNGATEAPSSHSPPPADLSVLRERLYNAERNFLSQRDELNEIRSTMATTGDIHALQASIASLSGKFDQIGRPQWQAVSVGVSVLALLGALVYMPIREGQVRNDVRLERIEDRIVPRSEHVERWRQFELADTRRTAEIDAVRNVLMPRVETSAHIANLQRQIDRMEADRRAGH